MPLTKTGNSYPEVFILQRRYVAQLYKVVFSSGFFGLIG